MVDRVGGRVVATGGPTNFPKEGTAKNIDLFIVAESLATLVRGVRQVEEVSTSPHRVVASQWHKCKNRTLQWTVRAPKAFPRSKPIGCAREPHAPSSKSVEEWAGGESEQGQREGLAGAWGDIVSAVEVELCGAIDRHRGTQPDQRYCGRAAGPRFVKTQALPPRVARMHGEVDPVTNAMLWARNRISEMGHLADIASGAVAAGGGEEGGRRDDVGTLSGGQWRQWNALVGKYTSRGSPVRKTLGHDQKWVVTVERLKACKRRPWQARAFQHATLDWVELWLKQKYQDHAKGKRRGWEQWLTKQLRSGAGGIHAWVKREQEQPETVLNVGGGFSAAPCDIVEADFKSWQEIWGRLERWAGTPWRSEASKKLCSDADELPHFGAKELRNACSTFATRTGWVSTTEVPSRCRGYLMSS